MISQESQRTRQNMQDFLSSWLRNAILSLLSNYWLKQPMRPVGFKGWEINRKDENLEPSLKHILLVTIYSISVLLAANHCSQEAIVPVQNHKLIQFKSLTSIYMPGTLRV
jgi:hypothetical protein